VKGVRAGEERKEEGKERVEGVRVREEWKKLDSCNCSQPVIVHSVLQLDYIFRNETLIQEIESKPIQKFGICSKHCSSAHKCLLH